VDLGADSLDTVRLLFPLLSCCPCCACFGPASACSFDLTPGLTVDRLLARAPPPPPLTPPRAAETRPQVEIMMALEEKFDITLDEEGAEKIATVQDAADLIAAQVSSK